MKSYIYLKGKKYRPQDISPINNFSLVNLKNELLAFLGWPYYILERLTILYAMFNFLGSFSSLLKGIYNTCTIHTQVNEKASVARILFAGFFGIFSTSIKKNLLDAQIKEYNTKHVRRTKKQYKYNAHSTTITNLNHNHPLSLVPRNFRNIALSDLITSRSNYPQSPIQHIITQEPNIDDTYEQTIAQPHTTKFRSQNNHLFSTR